jgi:NAD(P)H-hydrate epimerase
MGPIGAVTLLLGEAFDTLAAMKAVTTEQIQQLDQRTIAAGTPGAELMERAGYAVARTTMEYLRRHDSRSVLLFAGKGHNGGDAIVAARHLAAAGCQPALVLLCRRNELGGDTLAHFQKLGNAMRVLELPTLDQFAELVGETEPAAVVDGLLGTGLTGEVREPYATAIKVINGLHRAVVAIDIPSGLDSDTGEVRGVCVRADTTVTMGLPKIGLLRPAAAEFVGRIETVDIGFPRKLVEELQTDVELVTARDIAALLPKRPRAAHKGDFGHLLVIAGSEGYTGAPVLAAQAAARAGVGLVTLAVPRSVYRIVAAKCPPEVMPRPADFDKLDPTEFAGFNAVALGPGLGQQARTQKMIWKVVSGWFPPMVADADALNAIAQGVAVLKKLNKPMVLTPHPGEMGRLISKTSKEVQANRWDVARGFADEYGVVTVLKGAGTVIAEKSGPLWINSTGNPGMAKGGSGDALTGIIGAFLAQGMAPADAARAGVFIHGLAGDLASETVGERSMLTSDLIGHLGAAFTALD